MRQKTRWDQCTVQVLRLQSMVISLNFANPNFGFLPFASLNVLVKDMCTELVTNPISNEGWIVNE